MTVNDKITNALNVSPLRHLKLEKPVFVETGTTVLDAVAKMDKSGFGCVLIADKGKLKGIFTERDILMKLADLDRESTDSIDKYMSSDPLTYSGDKCISKAVREMNSHGYRHLPVMDESGDNCLGILTARIILDFVVEYLPDQVYNLPPTHDQSMLTPEGG